MLRFGTNSRLVLASLFILVVLMRMGGAHLHYCLDGTEAPVSLHMDSDGGVHHSLGVESQVSHSDIDVSITEDVPVKKSTLAFDLLALLFALPFLAQYFVQQRRIVPSLEDALIPVNPRSYGIPPLRGPPL
jgi:hypothetical protein